MPWVLVLGSEKVLLWKRCIRVCSGALSGIYTERKVEHRY